METNAVERVRLEVMARRFMVTMLALIAVWAGIAMILTGAPDFIEDWFSPWSRYFVGGIAFSAGLATSLGVAQTSHHLGGWWAQVVGLAVLTAWFAAMGMAYVGLVVMQGIEIVGPGEPLDASVTGRGYVPFVYLGLVVLSGTPLVTLLRTSRP